MSEYSFLKRQKLGVSRLKKGMYVAELDKPWRDSPFLLQGFRIEDDEQLQQLRQECKYVFVEFRSQADYEHYLLNQSGQSSTSDGEQDISFVEELPQAIDIYKNALKANKLELRKIQQGGSLSIETIETCVGEMIDSLQRNERALLLAANIRNKIHYTSEHPTRVAVLCLAFGIHLGMSPEQLLVFGESAMLHDVGKAAIPAKILEKSTQLDIEEIRMLKSHPKESFKLLSQIEGVSEVVKDVALSHHEREDGKGYPRHIPKDRVSRYAKLVSIADTYDAITSDRPYSKARSATVALKLLNDGKNKKFDSQLVSAFIDWVGVMPIGNLVEMESGEIAIVLKNHPQKKLKPEVMIITDQNRKQAPCSIVDLAKLESFEGRQQYQIRSLLANAAYGINIEHYLNKELFDAPLWLQHKKTSKVSPFDKYLK